jgi:hypothetical protein
MKASELIKELQDQINDVGDMNVITTMPINDRVGATNFVVATERNIIISGFEA